MVKNEKNEQLVIIFSRVLEVMIMKLNYNFAPLYLVFVLCKASTKIQKMNIQLLDRNLDIFPQNLKTSLQIQMIILKSRCHSKLILGFSTFQLL